MKDQNLLEKPTVINAPVNKIKPSPVNKRAWPKKDKGLQELADSIGSQGLIHPVLLRIDPKGKQGYELVAGERRLRAFKLLKFEVIPATIRTLTDQEAYTITATENLQREDLSPLEEAASVRVLMDQGQKPEEIADRLGKTVVWVHRRSKLVDLSPVWIKAFADQENPLCKWSALHMELIARYPIEKQDQLFKGFEDGYFEDISIITITDLKGTLEENMYLLNGAPWKLDMETLLPSAGPCSTCSTRSSCSPDLFDFTETKKGKEKDFCLNETCWGKKLIAYNKTRLAALKEKHSDLIVVTGDGNKTLPSDNPWKETAKSIDCFNNVKKSDWGAIPAYVIDGPGTGSVKYVKPWGSDSSGSANVKGQKKSMEEREKALLKRRTIRFMTKIIQLLDGVEPLQPIKGEDGNMLEPAKLLPGASSLWVVPGQLLTNHELFSLAAAFGVSSAGGYETRGFETHKKTIGLAEKESFTLCQNGVFDKISQQLHGETNSCDPSKKFAVNVCRVLYLDAKKLWSMVTEEIKEPKIWATLNKDGSKKKIVVKKEAGKKIKKEKVFTDEQCGSCTRFGAETKYCSLHKTEVNASQVPVPGMKCHSPAEANK